MEGHGPLAGIRVLDFCWFWAGPAMTSMLGDLGAEVIKVESRARIDGTRLGRPVIYQDIAAGDDGLLPELQPLNHGLNRNKLSVTLNMGTPEGKRLIQRLASLCDVVCDNFRAGVMKRNGLGYEDLVRLKSDIIVLSLSGAGQWGPWSDIATYAPTVCSLAGLSVMLGYPGEEPVGRMQPPYGDTNAGLYGVLAILHALSHRQQTGEGQFIDVSQWEAAICGMEEPLLDRQMNGRLYQSVGNISHHLCPHNNYRCAGEDQWISIAVGSEEEWRGLCDGLDRPEMAEDPRFGDGFLRWRHREELDAEIEALTSVRAVEVLEPALRERGVGAAKVMHIGDQFADPHLRSRDVYVEIQHPVVGEELVYGNPWQLSKTRATVRKAAPLLGEANDYVLKRLLGLSDEEIARLTEAQVVY